MVRDGEQQLAENVTEAKKGKNSKSLQEVPTLLGSQVKNEEPRRFNEYQMDFQTLLSPRSEVVLSPFYTTK